MKHNYRSILFDFDGTLVPNLDLVDMKQQVLLFSIGQGVPRAEIESLYIVELIDHAAEWLQQQNTALAEQYFQQAHRLIRDIEIEAAQEVTLFPGTRELLLRLKTAGIGSGIVTRNCAQAVTMMFPDAEDYCDVILTRDHVEYLKPDPRHLQQALQQLQCDAQDAVMIGDGVLDMSAGKTLEMYCIGVLTGSNNAAALEQAGADLILNNITELQL